MSDVDLPRTPRQRAREAFVSDLVATAQRHLRQDGAAHLSLRAVARDLGVSSSAVYRYVDSRDALLTLLIVDAYERVGEAFESAEREAVEAGLSPAEIWLSAAGAFRDWARDNRNSYELIYGTPIPGYAAPEDTVPAASRVWGVIARTLARSGAEGTLHEFPAPVPVGLVEPEVVQGAFELTRDIGDERPSETDIMRAVTLFASLVGAVTAELFGHLRGFTSDHTATFEVIVAAAAHGAGLGPANTT